MSVKDCYPGGQCPDCFEFIPDNAVEGDSCINCGHGFWADETEFDYNDYDDELYFDDEFGEL